MKLTTIDLPHRVLETVGHILAEAGFTLGTVGSGMAQMERGNEISDEEAIELSHKIGEALCCFEVEELDEDEE
jgi:hypothetical protein